MKRVLLTVVTVILMIAILSSLVFAGTGTTDKPQPAETEKKEKEKSENQEFIWDDTNGTFRKVDLYNVGEMNKHLKNIEKNLSSGDAIDGSLLGTPSSYTYWDGKNWVTLESISRFEGEDQRAEALVTRYDLTQYTFSTANWDTITGYQSLYSSYISYLNDQKNTRPAPLPELPKTVDKNAPQTHFSSRVIGFPDSYDPVVEVQLANGWKVTINSRYDRSGAEVRLTSPDGNTSFIYGDAELKEGISYKGGTEMLDNYVFDLNGYTLKLETGKDEKDKYRISNIRLSGPNGYLLTFNRNNEVRVYGGTK